MAAPKTKTTSKRYFARVAHSRFIFSDGTELVFAFGKADVDILEQQQELDAILGKNPNIYVQETLPEILPKVAQNALSDAEVAATERTAAAAGARVQTDTANMAQNHVAGMFGEIQADSPQNPADSSIDMDIQNAMQSNQNPQQGIMPLAPPIVGPGALSRIEQLKREAADRTSVIPMGAATSVSGQ